MGAKPQVRFQFIGDNGVDSLGGTDHRKMLPDHERDCTGIDAAMTQKSFNNKRCLSWDDLGSDFLHVPKSWDSMSAKGDDISLFQKIKDGYESKFIIDGSNFKTVASARGPGPLIRRFLSIIPSDGYSMLNGEVLIHQKDRLRRLFLC